MDTEMQPVEDQCDFFCLFHDGSFTGLQRKGNDREFQIEIHYLAEMINPTYTTFSVTLKNCHYCALEMWDTLRDEDINVIQTSIDGLEILHATCKKNQVHVICAGGFKSVGGSFIFSCERVRVFDEGRTEITLDALKDIATRYWKNFSQRQNKGHS